jgi:ubiquitin-protein ligase
MESTPEKKEESHQSNNPTDKDTSTSTESNKSNPQKKTQNNLQQQPLNRAEIISNEIKEIFEEQTLIKQKNLSKKKDFFELELIVLKEMIQTEKDISLLIIIPFNYPKYEPEIYCLTQFCTPHLCDGRNLLYDIIKKPWQRKIHTLDFVINKLPGFFLSFNEYRIKNKNLIVRKFLE